MASIIIRGLEESVKSKLRVRAAEHGRSMEAEAREILRAGVDEPAVEPVDLVQAIRKRIEPLGGVELRLPKRQLVRRPPSFR